MRSPESGVSPPTVATIRLGNNADGMEDLRLAESGAEILRQSGSGGGGDRGRPSKLTEKEE